MEKRIKEMVLGLGADVCGIAHIDRFAGAPEGFHPRDIFPECRSVVVFGVALPKGLAKVSPRIIYGHFNDSSSTMADWITFQAAKEMERLGACTVPLPADGPYEFWDAERLEGRGLISMKHAAVLAGLGCLGKNTLLLNAQYGNMLTLGAVLTDMGLASDPPAQSICLPGCDLCILNCPTQALNGEHANQSRCRPHAYGANARGFDVVNCNTCRTVCPMRFGEK